MFILVAEKYFDMNKKHAREALDIYKRFLIRMDRVGEFLKTAEKFGIDKQDIPDLARVRIKDGILNQGGVKKQNRARARPKIKFLKNVPKTFYR